jgi:hypothetical protein
MDNRQRWERVLAAVEADARRAEALLAAADGEPVPEPEPVPTAMAVPADWLLPAGHAAGPEGSVTAFDTDALPPLHAMPPVPDELRDRIVDLQARITALQQELARALRDWQPAASIPVAGARSRTPVFIDTAL